LGVAGFKNEIKSMLGLGAGCYYDAMMDYLRLMDFETAGSLKRVDENGLVTDKGIRQLKAMGDEELVEVLARVNYGKKVLKVAPAVIEVLKRF